MRSQVGRAAGAGAPPRGGMGLRIAAAAALLVAVAAAVLWYARGAPESQARAFIEALVHSPAEAERLRALAGLPADADPQAPVTGLAARVGIEFLRARAAQGARLRFGVAEGTRPDATHRVVTVSVAERDAAAAAAALHFRVRLEAADGDWRITAVETGNPR